MGLYTYIQGNNIRKLPVQLSLSQTSKNVMVSFVYFISFFFLTKSMNRRAEQILHGGEGLGVGFAPVTGTSLWRKRVGRCMLCKNVCKYKNDTC
jgi:hypothetical protein